MNFLLIAFGTRGDVQPIVALGKGLQAAGHVVSVCASEIFGDWVRSHGLGFAPLRVDMQAMMQSDDGVAWVEARRPTEQMRAMKTLFKSVGGRMAQDMLDASREADVIVGGFTSDCFAKPISDALGKRYFVITLQPLYPTRLGEATIVPFRAQGESIMNRFYGQFAERYLYTVFDEEAVAFQRKLGQTPFTRASYYAHVHSVPTACGFSPHVVPRPRDWPAHMQATGYWFLDEDAQWQPSPALQRFLDAGPPPVYVGFGSMTSSDAEGKADTVLQAVIASGRRAIIARGWGALDADDANPNVFVLKSAPHSWLFPRMAGVVHHGGAGTTAAGFRAGAPQFIVPHFADQPYWARRAHELGVGPKPVGQSKLSVERLAQAIRDVADNPVFRQRAAELGQRIRDEDGVSVAVNLIERIVG